MADIDDLKAAFEQLVTAFNKGNLDAWSAMYHDQASLKLANVPFAVDGKAERQQSVQTFFAKPRARQHIPCRDLSALTSVPALFPPQRNLRNI